MIICFLFYVYQYIILTETWSDPQCYSGCNTHELLSGTSKKNEEQVRRCEEISVCVLDKPIKIDPEIVGHA